MYVLDAMGKYSEYLGIFFLILRIVHYVTRSGIWYHTPHEHRYVLPFAAFHYGSESRTVALGWRCSDYLPGLTMRCA
jgi:hypothetical protein